MSWLLSISTSQCAQQQQQYGCVLLENDKAQTVSATISAPLQTLPPPPPPTPPPTPHKHPPTPAVDEANGRLVSDPTLTFQHAYPPTKIMFIPDR